MTFDSFYKNVMSLNAEEIILEAAALREEELADYNVGNLEDQKLSTGEKIEPKYTESYAEFKGFRTPDLKLTGNFHSRVYADVKVKSGGIVFNSTDYKGDKLVKKYTDDIYGVTDDQLIEITDADIVGVMDKKMTVK